MRAEEASSLRWAPQQPLRRIQVSARDKAAGSHHDRFGRYCKGLREAVVLNILPDIISLRQLIVTNGYIDWNGMGPAPAAGPFIGDAGTELRVDVESSLNQDADCMISQTEGLFHTYAQYASMTKLPPQPSEEEQRIEGQLRDLLEKV